MNFLDLIETEIAREFDYDYIIFDAIFLGIFLILLIQQKRFKPLAIGGITAILTYIIDAGFWYNTPSSIPGTNIREYIISFEGVPFTGIQFNLLKFGCDFMMTISYSLVAFSWVWIMFENWNKKRYKDSIFWTCLLFGGWMIIPWLSILFNLNQINVLRKSNF